MNRSWKRALFFAAPICVAAQLQRSAGSVSVTTTPEIRFEDRQRQSGVEFVLNNHSTPDKHMIESTLGGVALLDFNNDQFLDIYFVNGASIPSLTKDGPAFHNRLYRNNRDGTFADVTEKAGVSGFGYDMGVAAGDFDNDGWVDLYVAGVNRNVLYRNNGDGTFVDVTQKSGVNGYSSEGRKLWSVAAAWLDHDRDGDLDLFVVNYLDWSFSKAKTCGEEARRLSCSPALYSGLPNFLYRNNGDGTFADISAQSGIGQHIGKGMSVAVADYDSDGYPEIFVTNDNERNFLFHNLGGEKFEEVGVEVGIALPEDGIPISSMGVDFRDLNNDGQPDVSITALAGETFPLFLNEGTFFRDATYGARIGLATLRRSGWGVGMYDFDNDGYKDLFFANSHVSENVNFYVKHHLYKLANAVFRNLGDGIFLDVSAAAGPAMQLPRAHRGSAFGDLNNDGKVDAVVSIIGEPVEVLYNISAHNHHWILLDLQGEKNNRQGIGTRVKLTGQSGRVQYNHASTAGSYASSLDPRIHFGLGGDSRVREIELRWPGGQIQILRDVAADQILKVVEQ